MPLEEQPKRIHFIFLISIYYTYKTQTNNATYFKQLVLNTQVLLHTLITFRQITTIELSKVE
jgi:hypothetical protein